jgi:hypothetical protein
LSSFKNISHFNGLGRFLAFSTGISDSAQQSVAGQKRTANVEQATGLLSSLIGETSVTQRWVVSIDA